MKKFVSILMAVCMLVCMAAPAMAQAADLTDSIFQLLDSGVPEDAPTIGDSGGVSGDETPPPEVPADGSEATQGMTPFSDFGGGDVTFTTLIRLTVTDRKGNSIEGAVYGLYRSDDSTLVQELVTNESGISESDDVPVNTNYYLEEITAPEGFQSNTNKQEIDLTGVCAPSRIDVLAEYDPIIGRIKVIKTDEEGNTLSGMGFCVYRYSDWEKVDDITVGEDGTATTADLPYGEYALEEYNIPDGLAADLYYTAAICNQGETVELEIVNYPAKGDVKITKTGNDGRKITGAVFEIYNAHTDELVQTVTTDNTGYIWSSYIPLGNYYAVETSVPAPYKLDDTHHEFSLTYNTQSAYLNIENKVDGEPGRIKVIKTDDSSNPLSDVSFDLFRSWDGTKLSTLTTGEDGTAESGSLIPGDYYLVETNGKPGYTMEAGQIPFTIDGTGGTIELNVVNPKIRIFGKVQVMKQDDAGTPIPGVRFGVYCDQDKLLEEITTGEDGTATSGVLNEGNYYLLELAGADGYQMDTEPHPFSISENEVVVPVTVTNPRITGTVKVLKTGMNGEPLSGVVFGVYLAADDTELGTLTTGKDGAAVSDSLFYGDYYLKELSTADGFELLDAPIPFSIMEQDAVIEIPVTNPLIMGGVSVYKISADKDNDGNDISLAGAVFGLYNSAGQKLAELTTGDDGQAEYSSLPKGSYYLKELAAPEGFTATDELHPFSIETQGQRAEITVTNGAGFGTVEIQKTGEDGDPLSGVKFDVFRASTVEKVGGLVSDETGAASMTLPLGRYYLVETETAEGYKLLSGQISFTLTADGETVTLPIANQRDTCQIEGGHIRLTKTDVDTGAMLPGAAFGIYRVDDDTKAGEITTGTDGTATSLLLPAGDYYLLELRAPAAYEIKADKIPVTVLDGSTTETNATNKRLPEPKPEPEIKTSTVKMIKIDADDKDKTLSGAVFSVYETATGNKIGELLTGKDGTASLELPEGDFTLRETTAPEGYALSTESISVHLKAGETLELTVANHREEAKPGTLRLIKVDADDKGKLLSGAVFSIFDTATGKKVSELLTGKDGAASLELPEGDFTLRETTAPEGYALSTESISVHLKAGETRELTVTNKKEEAKTGILRVVKVDKDGKKKLKDAVFGIYSADNDKKLDEITTDRQGVAELELLEGDYYLQELEAPDGYQLLDKNINFSITSGETTEKTVKNSKEDFDEDTGTLVIIKEDKSTGEGLRNAVFGIYNSDGDKIDEVETGRDGTAELDLDADSYYLRELEAPEGYRKDGKKITFKVTADKTTKVTVKNEKVPEDEKTGTLRLVKSAAGTGARLSGASFAVYTADGNKKAADLITDADGVVDLELPVGGYYLKEQRAPEGFKLETARILFTITADAKTIVEVTNEKEGTPAPATPQNPGTPDDTPQVTIPKTGEAFPILQYVLAALLLAASALCGAALYCKRETRNQ